jgi:four helix bundle protein
MHNYKELKVWQKSIELATLIYQLANQFPKEEKFRLMSQILRAVVSISSNFAEGAGRNSESEFNQFLGYARGSSFELETQIIIANKLAYLSTEELLKAQTLTNEIQKMLYGLKASINS